jgi:hypothetical protein
LENDYDEEGDRLIVIEHAEQEIIEEVFERFQKELNDKYSYD